MAIEKEKKINKFRGLHLFVRLSLYLKKATTYAENSRTLFCLVDSKNMCNLLCVLIDTCVSANGGGDVRLVLRTYW